MIREYKMDPSQRIEFCHWLRHFLSVRISWRISKITQMYRFILSASASLYIWGCNFPAIILNGLTVKYFWKKLCLRCLTGFRMDLFIISFILVQVFFSDLNLNRILRVFLRNILAGKWFSCWYIDLQKQSSRGVL